MVIKDGQEKGWKLWQICLAVFDQILHPKLYTYPLAFTDDLSQKVRPPKCLFVFSREIKDDQQMIWYLRGY